MCAMIPIFRVLFRDGPFAMIDHFFCCHHKGCSIHKINSELRRDVCSNSHLKTAPGWKRLPGPAGAGWQNAALNRFGTKTDIVVRIAGLAVALLTWGKNLRYLHSPVKR
jgi:hypothetical protein